MTFIERPVPNDPADPFLKMATRIAHNTEGARFGGAVVIVPPDGGGEPIEILFLDQAADAAVFWSILSAKIRTVIDDLDAKSKQGWQGRR